MHRRQFHISKVQPIYENDEAGSEETGDVEAGDSDEDTFDESESDREEETALGMPSAIVADFAPLSSMTKLTLDLMANRSVYHQYLGTYEPQKMEKIRQENAEITEHRALIMETTKSCLNKLAGRPIDKVPNADIMDAFMRFAKRVMLENEYEKNNGKSDQLLGDCLEGEDISMRIWGRK